MEMEMEMEMDAGGATSKRRRRGVGADRISALPDDLLGEIVALLPTVCGARTQILASRWRHIWRSAPLNLDCNNFGTRNFTVLIQHILSSHQGHGRCFRVSTFKIEKPSDPANTRSAVVDAWLRLPALDNLQELDVCCCYDANPVHPLSPPSILRFSATLRLVSLQNCNLSGTTVQGLCFPNLTRLTLKGVSVSESWLSHIIAGCPVLDCFEIYGSFGFRCLRINSRSLTCIAVRTPTCHQMNEIQCRELIIENAPCLTRLLHLQQYSNSTEELHVSVLSAPKLETLRCVLNAGLLSTKLSFRGSTIVQGLHVDSSLTVVVHTVKILAVSLNHLSLDMVINLMRCFPCLEKLHFQVTQPCQTSEKNLWRRKYRNLATCLDIRLKTIVLISYRGSMSEVNFFTFFVLNAKVLESVILVVGAKSNSEDFIAKQRRKLQLENRASRGAQFHFTTKICVSYSADVQCL